MMMASVQHANAGFWFNTFGERLLVGLWFHHMDPRVGMGHECSQDGKALRGGLKFGVLVPWWEIAFGTANFDRYRGQTGVHDRLEHGVDCRQGFWSQQWLSYRRLVPLRRA